MPHRGFELMSSWSGVRRSNQIASWPVELVFISGGFYNLSLSLPLVFVLWIFVSENSRINSCLWIIDSTTFFLLVQYMVQDVKIQKFTPFSSHTDPEGKLSFVGNVSKLMKESDKKMYEQRQCSQISFYKFLFYGAGRGQWWGWKGTVSPLFQLFQIFTPGNYSTYCLYFWSSMVLDKQWHFIPCTSFLLWG